MNNKLTGVIALAAFVLLALVTLFMKAAPIETDLEARAVAAVSDQPFRWARVEMDGRDAILSGIPPSEWSRSDATALVEEIPGIRRVIDKTRTVPVESPFVWSLGKSGNGLRMSGALPNPAFRDLLKLKVASVLGGQVADETHFARGIPENGWLAAALLGISQLGALDEGVLTLTDKRGVLKGQSQYSGAQQRFEKAYEALMPAGYVFAADISAGESPRAVPAEADICREAFAELLAGRSVGFSSGGSTLDNEDILLLGKLAEAAGSCPNTSVEISGFVEGGDFEDGLLLSRQRAETVARAMQFAGVGSSRMIVKAYGAAFPVLSQSKADDRSVPRSRIEFRFKAAKEASK